MKGLRVRFNRRRIIPLSTDTILKSIGGHNGFSRSPLAIILFKSPVLSAVWQGYSYTPKDGSSYL
jgi:hypothetical protein